MTTPNPRTDLTDLIRDRLAQGFDTHDQILDEVVEIASEDYDPEGLHDLAVAVLADVLDERGREMATWPAVTDCDRLDNAFEELNAQGILARHNWTCCSNCGRAEMPDEFKRLDGHWEGVPIVGYVFYHIQDTESAAGGDGLYLNFGSTCAADSEAEYEAASVKIAEAARNALARRGLEVTWDGSYGQRPHVQLTWQRRAKPARFCGT